MKTVRTQLEIVACINYYYYYYYWCGFIVGLVRWKSVGHLSRLSASYAYVSPSICCIREESRAQKSSPCLLVILSPHTIYETFRADFEERAVDNFLY